MHTTAAATIGECDDLVRRVRTDRAAFAGLYDVFYPRILRYCGRRLLSQSVSEDLTSDIFLTVATKIDTFRGQSEGEFSQWVYTIATNRINAYLRSTERRRRLLESAAESGQIASPQNEDSVDHLDWPAVREAIMQLKPRDQTLISLRLMQDLPHDQIAAIMNLKPGTVRVALSRTLQSLRDQFSTDAGVWLKIGAACAAPVDASRLAAKTKPSESVRHVWERDVYISRQLRKRD